MLRKSYDWLTKYASRPHAMWMLLAVSFAESSIFPIPPDPLFVLMVLKQPKRAWQLAFLCALSSVIGGILGYYIGYALYESLGEWIISTYGLQETFLRFQKSFQEWGFWIIALKGLTPIPYKVVTIFSGLTHLKFATFIIASIIARSFRFLSVALLLKYAGPQVQEFIDKNLGLVTTFIIFVLFAGFLALKYL